jgi:hypothetical protein
MIQMVMPSLVGTADNDGLPTTDKFLFIGGPKHGQHVEVIDSDPTFKVMAPPTMLTGEPLSVSGGYEVHTYVKRKLGYRDDDGQAYERAVFVHEVIPGAEVAQQLLMAALMADFVKGGRKVIEPDGKLG